MPRKSKEKDDQPAPEIEVVSMEEYERLTQAKAVEIWQHTDTGHILNLEEQLFVRSYIIDRNPVAALRRLGHVSDDASKLKLRAHRYLSKSEVVGAIEQLAGLMMAKLEITAERVNRKIAAAAFFDIRDVASFDGVSLNLLHSRFWTEAQASAIKSIKMGKEGVEIQMYDGLRAAELLAKQLGVQPPEDDRAEAARVGAESAMAKIMQIFDRVVPDDPAPEQKRLSS